MKNEIESQTTPKNMKTEDSITIKVAIPTDETIGKKVIRTKGSRGQIGDRGTIVEAGFNGGNGFDGDRFRIKWDRGIRTWLNKNSFELL